MCDGQLGVVMVKSWRTVTFMLHLIFIIFILLPKLKNTFDVVYACMLMCMFYAVIWLDLHWGWRRGEEHLFFSWPRQCHLCQCFGWMGFHVSCDFTCFCFMFFVYHTTVYHTASTKTKLLFSLHFVGANRLGQNILCKYPVNFTPSATHNEVW